MMTSGKILELVIRVLPYPDQIRNIQLANGQVSFEWRGAVYVISDDLGCNEKDGSFLLGSDASILLSALLKCNKGLVKDDES